ncbi:uncharacterized protein [Drosophila kikkawai]|uniref:Uncharacterized protein n=1 Tax=Drosophila kikkawai TaxID=30033 RepID=A0A6P4J0U5_DROKI|nr:uncharacterized protein LOC108079279 [Drosophila kikkawai]
MSEQPEISHTYETECQRAELLGLQPPDRADFERKRQARLEHELAEQEAAEAVLLEQQDETLGGVGGKLGELNSILSSTQQKLNRFKQTACGSLTNIFSRASSGSVDLTAGGTAAGPTQEERPPVLAAKPPPTAAEVSAAKAAKQKRMDSQLDKLDSLINQADNAQIAMSEQTQQMRRLAK